MTIERVNERELLTAATQGSQVAFRELIHLHQGAVYRFAWAMIGDEQAQQVTENAFLTAWRQLEYLKSFHMSFGERLLQLVCDECAAATKRQRRHRVNLPSAQDEDALNFPVPPLRYDPRTNMEHLALQMDIEEALRALPLHFRQILLLHEMADLADTQIAGITGSDAQTVHTDLARARGFMRRQIILGGGFFPPSDTSDEKGRDIPKVQACKAYLPTLSAAADDLCTNAEKQTLSVHMAECPGCQAYYDSLRAIHHGIAVMKREVPGDMASYIIHRIQQEEGKGDLAAPGEKPERRRFRAIHHGIAVMKREVPGDMASYIIHRIQQEEGKGDLAAPGEKPERRRFRPAFGRFTIIGLCLALILLAYSNGLLERAQNNENDPPQPPTQEQQTPSPAFGRFTIIGLCLALILLAYSNGLLERAQNNENDPPQPPTQEQQTPSTSGDPTPQPPAEPTPPPAEPDTPPAAEDPAAPADPDAPDAPDTNQSEGTSSQEDPSIVPGSGASSTLIPAGRTYAAIYTADAAASEILSRYCAFSFQSTMTDGSNILYYVVPAANSGDLCRYLYGRRCCQRNSQPLLRFFLPVHHDRRLQYPLLCGSSRQQRRFKHRTGRGRVLPHPLCRRNRRGSRRGAAAVSHPSVLIYKSACAAQHRRFSPSFSPPQRVKIRRGPITKPFRLRKSGSRNGFFNVCSPISGSPDRRQTDRAPSVRALPSAKTRSPAQHS